MDISLPPSQRWAWLASHPAVLRAAMAEARKVVAEFVSDVVAGFTETEPSDAAAVNGNGAKNSKVAANKTPWGVRLLWALWTWVKPVAMLLGHVLVMVAGLAGRCSRYGGDMAAVADIAGVAVGEVSC